MAPSFPLPRSAIPPVAESARERAAARRVMLCLLEHTVAQFDAQMVARRGEVDADVWQPVSSPADRGVRVFRERVEGESSRSLTREANAALMQGGADLSQREAHQLRSTYLSALAAPAVMATSCATGKVEGAMFAVLAPTNDETALLASFMLDDVADIAMLRAIDQEQRQTSASFLGYKYVVRSASTTAVASVGRKFYDQCYLEFCGYTHSPTSGERLGFHLVHSVDLREFPDLSAFHSSRGPPFSVRYLFRQKSEKAIEVFSLGNAAELGSVVTPFWDVKQLIACAEAKRLTQMVRRSRDNVEFLGQSTRRSSECYSCRRSKRPFSCALLSECKVCRQFVCTKCRNDKKVFESGAQSSHCSIGETSTTMGRFDRVTTCKTCVLVASACCAPPPMHMLISDQMRMAGRDRAATRSRSGSSSGGSRSSISMSGGRSQSGRSTVSSTSGSSTATVEDSARGPRSQRPMPISILESDSQRQSLESSSRGVRQDRVHLGQSSVAVSMGYTVPLRAPVSIAKTRARQQQQQQQEQQPTARCTSSIHYNMVDVVKPVMHTQQPTQQYQKALPLHRSTSQPPGRDLALDPLDVHSLRRNSSTTLSSGSTSTSPSSGATSPSAASLGSDQQDSLYARMMELSKVIESTYNTTQQNGACIAHQARQEAQRAL